MTKALILKKELTALAGGENLESPSSRSISLPQLKTLSETRDVGVDVTQASGDQYSCRIIVGEELYVLAQTKTPFDEKTYSSVDRIFSNLSDAGVKYIRALHIPEVGQ